MKKFIIISVMAVLMAMCFTAKAQYVNPTTDDAIKVATITSAPQSSLAKMSEYIDAKELEHKGQSRVFEGVVWQGIGGAIALTSIPLKNADEYASVGMIVVGGISFAIGTVIQVIGTYQWVMGSTKKKNLQVEYALRGNGLVVSF